MRRIRVFLPLLVILFEAVSASAWAADDEGAEKTASPVRRTCEAEDLVGKYILVWFGEYPPGVETTRYGEASHRYIAFYPNRSYGSLAMNMPLQFPERLEGMLKASAAQYRSYALRPEGVLDLYTGGKLDHHYRCVANIADNGKVRKGDIMLTAYSQDGQSTVHNLYRPLR